MINLRFKGRLVFFDRSIIRTNWKKINDRPLRRAGALVRRIARGSIRRVTRKAPPSNQGTPPRSRHPAAPFKLIYNLPYRMGSQEIIGMVGFSPGGTPTPGLHEHGGFARRLVYVKGKRGRPGNPRKDKRMMRTVRYPQRAFMWPALLKARTKLPQFWRGSLN